MDDRRVDSFLWRNLIQRGWERNQYLQQIPNLSQVFMYCCSPKLLEKDRESSICELGLKCWVCSRVQSPCFLVSKSFGHEKKSRVFLWSQRHWSCGDWKIAVFLSDEVKGTKRAVKERKDLEKKGVFICRVWMGAWEEQQLAHEQQHKWRSNDEAPKGEVKFPMAFGLRITGGACLEVCNSRSLYHCIHGFSVCEDK
jgi:hypothetical protein